MAISYEKFIEKYDGKSVATPNGNFEGECVSVVQRYLNECFDIKSEARGDANVYAGNIIKEGLATKVSVKNIKKGDIISYPAGHAGCHPQYGHVAIYYDKDHVFQQNVNYAGDGVVDDTASLNHGFTPKLDSSCTIARMKKAPVVDKEEKPETKPTTKYKFKKGQEVIVTGKGNTQADGKGIANGGVGYERVVLEILEGEPYPYRVGNAKGTLGFYKEDELKASNGLNKGNKVKIIGVGKESANGTGKNAYGIGWQRRILEVHTGAKYPYEVGNNKGTTGFYQANDLEKI